MPAPGRERREWTPAEDKTLRLLAADGESFGLIGAKIGRTKNSCIGRAQRLGIASTRRPNMRRKTRADYLTQRRADGRATLNAFAEALAECGRIDIASTLVGISHQRGSQLFAIMKHELGWQAHG